MNIKGRVQKLEERQQPQQPTLDIETLEYRINRVMDTPEFVSPAAYNRIVELLKIARERKAKDERNI